MNFQDRTPGSGNGAALTLWPESLVIAGWTARDEAAVHHHVEELAALGVPPPSSFPLYYRGAASLLTQGERLQAVGSDTSGEVEPLLIHHDGTLWLGVASDHTDRALESHSVALSKQACAKPCAPALWRLEALADRLDTLELRAWIGDSASGDWTLYQDGTLATIRPLMDLVMGAGLAGLPAPAAMLCGTVAAIGGVRPAHRFRMQLRDPASGVTIEHAYSIDPLPIVA